MDENARNNVSEVLDVGAEELEAALNDMLPGLTNHVRDVNLDPGVAALYKPGMVIRDKAFIGASKRVGGFATTHRSPSSPTICWISRNTSKARTGDCAWLITNPVSRFSTSTSMRARRK